jgi:hypothetical protein
MSNDTLLCVPFFTFMGLILERSGMAEDLLDTIGQVFGPVRGGPPPRSSSWAHCSPRRPAWSRIGDLDGAHLAADHAALRLRPAVRPRA